jgi:hypothetical protein
MSHRLEVLPGPGTVLRHGDVAVWAGPTCSPALLSFLIQSARNVGESNRSGLQIVDHIAGILSTRDPEPGAPFAVIGPSNSAWVTLLHGPVQLWDGSRWLAPTPNPGWLRADVTPQPAVGIGPAGGASPRLSPDSVYDLETGTVPGGGLLFVPDPDRADRPLSPGAYRPTATPTPTAAATPGAGPTPTAGPTPYPVSAPRRETEASGSDQITAPGPTLTGRPPAGGGRWRADTPPAGAREWVSLQGVSAPPRPPLPIGPAPTASGRPEVAGVRCTEGHLNPPDAGVCASCGRSIAAGRPSSIGPRPVLGVLIAADDGQTFRLDGDQVLGRDPTADQGVASGRLRGVALTGAPGQLAPAHAEIRLENWTVTVIDRGSAAGTFVVPAGTTGWVRLTPYQPVALTPGSHLSVGQRVLTYLSPWPG